METTTRLDAGIIASEADDGSTASDEGTNLRRHVLERLSAEGWRFDFFQAVRLLEQIFPRTTERRDTSSARLDRIQIRPDDALTFPATDVRRIQVDDEGEGVQIDVTFMGLYGISSPLPPYFSEPITSQPETSSALRGFLDIFSHRLHSLFYRAWKKYRPEASYREDGLDGHSRRFSTLTGLGQSQATSDAPERLLRAFAGRLLPRARNAEGLSALVSAAVSLPATVVENVPRWVPMRQRPQVGGSGGMQLGRSATIGQRLLDVMGKLRVSLGPMDATEYEALLPGGTKAAMLGSLIRTYVAGYLDYDVELRLNPGALQPTRLSDSSSRLGYTACLGTPTDEALVRVVRYEKAA